MPSTFTTNTGIEKPGDGEQAGLWGDTVNLNSDLIDRSLNGVGTIVLATTSYTLTTSSGTLSDGQYAAITFTGTPGGTATVTIAPATAQKTYAIRNSTNQSIVLTQGSGGNVTLAAGASAIVACTGAGASSAVFDITALMNTATSVNTANAVVRRDGSGAIAVTGVVGDLTGNVTTSLITLGGTAVTASAAELNILDGVTATTAELNLLDGVTWTLSDYNTLTATAAELNLLDGVTWTLSDYNTLTASAAELNILDGVTATTVELNILDGVTASAAELNLLDGVTWTLSDYNTLTASAAELNILDGVTASTSEINTLDGINTAGNFGLVPQGGIIMWSGSVASIPAGWLLCDGTSGTPNLQNRFIVGAGDTHAPGATGGSDSTTLAEENLPSHTHSFSATTGAGGSHSHSTTSDGNHTHRFTYGVRNIGGSTAGGFGPSFFGSPITAVDDGSITEVRTRDNMVQNVNSGHSHTISTAADHTHTVSGTTGATGSGTAIDNRPAFYALAYIMKA